MKIKIIGNGEFLHEADLSEGNVVIGRAEGCDVVLPYGYISFRHAEIGLHDGSVYISDLGSTNGVIINGVEIEQPTYVEPGMSCVLGEMELMFSVSSPVACVSDDNQDSAFVGLRRDMEGIPAPVEDVSVSEESSCAIVVETAGSHAGGEKKSSRKKLFRKSFIMVAVVLAGLLAVGGGFYALNADPVLSLVEEGRLAECKAFIAERLYKYESNIGGDESDVLSKAMENEDYTLDLARFEILRACGVDNIEKLFWLDGADEFLKLLFSDRLWMENLLAAGPPSNVGSDALYRLYSIWRTDPECATHPIYHKIAVAVAISGGTYNPDKTSAVSAVRQYSWYRKYREMGRLHTSFDSLPPWLMKKAILGDVKAATFCNADRNGPTGSFWGSCWACGYKLHNIFSDSIHGSHYYPPWFHRMTRMEANRRVGGVCGSLSTYAHYIHSSHGIPSSTAGQPGHCAYVRRDPKGRWGVGYSIKNPTSAYACYWNRDASYLNFMEDVFKDWDAVLKSCRYIWQARMHQDCFERENDDNIVNAEEKQVMLSPATRISYNLAVQAHPIHRGIWDIYLKIMAEDSGMTNKEWKSVVISMCEAMKKHHRPMRDTIAKPLAILKDRLSASERVDLIVKLHKTIGSNAGMSGANLTYIGEKDAQFRLLGRLLDMYDAGSKDWSAVVGAARKQYAKNGELMLRFNKILSSRIGNGTKSPGAQAVISSLRASLLLAAKEEDIDSYNTLYRLITDLYSGEELGRRYLNKKQEDGFPKFEPFARKLLSADGILRVSSSHGKYDVPQLHPSVLKDDPRGGWFMTNSEKEPWAMVVLPGPAKLFGIIIVNRYETDAYRKSQVPLRVEVSADGKKWQQVFTTESPDAFWRIDLGEKGMQAKYVRCKADHKAKASVFHLRSILVYGEKLY